MSQITRYWKAVLAAITAIAITVVQAVQAAGADGDWSREDTIVTILAFLGAVAVYTKANTPPAGELSDPNMSETSSRSHFA